MSATIITSNTRKQFLKFLAHPLLLVSMLQIWLADHILNGCPKAVLSWVSIVISRLLRLCIATRCDWLKNSCATKSTNLSYRWFLLTWPSVLWDSNDKGHDGHVGAHNKEVHLKSFVGVHRHGRRENHQYPKPIATHLYTFSRTWQQLHVFALSSDWFIRLSASLVTDGLEW